MLAPMVKVRIVGRKDLLEDTVNLLGELAVVHLNDANRGNGELGGEVAPCEETERTQARRDALRASLRQVEEAAALLHIDLGASSMSTPTGTGVVDLQDDLVILRTLTGERKEILDELAVAERYRKLCQAFAPALEGLGELKHVSSVGVTLDARYQDHVIPILRKRLEEMTGGAYQLLWEDLDPDTVGILLLFPPGVSRDVTALLSRESIHEIRLPKRYEGLSLREGLVSVDQLLRELPGRLQEVEEALKQYRESHEEQILAEHQRLREALDRTEVARLFAATRYLFVIEGYVPERSLGRLRSTLAERVGDPVQVLTFPATAEDRSEVPIAFENLAFFRPFERLLAFLPPPRFGTVDPTPLISLSFPLFFGIILGDVGYGLVILAFGWGVRRRWGRTPLGRDLSFILAVVAASSVLFGFVYGELFGDLGHRLGLRPVWEDRLRAVAALLVLTVSIGVAHVVLAFLLEAFQAARFRLPGRLAASVANVLAVAAVLVLVAALASFLPPGSWRLAAAVLVLALAVLIYLEGMVALIEVVSAVGNILSYSRLMAIGLASAALAVVANRLGGATGDVVVGFVVALVLHGINLVLGIFGPTVHGLRLHYVEFLPKFYHYGGRAYRPFRKGETP